MWEGWTNRLSKWERIRNTRHQSGQSQNRAKIMPNPSGEDTAATITECETSRPDLPCQMLPPSRLSPMHTYTPQMVSPLCLLLCINSFSLQVWRVPTPSIPDRSHALASRKPKKVSGIFSFYNRLAKNMYPL